MQRLIDAVLGLTGWPAYLLIGGLAFAEAAAMVGLVVPGEVAVLLGGVLASTGNVSLPVMIGVVASAAIVGDSVGYELGRRFGPRLVASPRLPRRFGLALQAAQEYVRARGGRAVFLARWTALLRATVPAVAGMARMPYGRFLAFNLAGGVAWAIAFVTAGYLAGASWRRVEQVAGRASLVLLGLLALGLLIRWATRRLTARPETLQRALHAMLGWRAIAALRSRFAAQLRWVAARFTPGAARGLGWTLSAIGAVTAGWILGAVVQDLLAREELLLLDAPVAAWFTAHRTPAVTTVADPILTAVSPGWGWLPALAVSVLVRLRTRSWAPAAMVMLSAAAATGTVLVVHALVPTVNGVRFPSAATAFSAAIAVAAVAGLANVSWTSAIRTSGVGLMALALVSVAALATGRATLSGTIGGAALGALLAILFEFTVRTVRPAAPPARAEPETGTIPGEVDLP